ncbi:MAG: hypothetical protein NDJ90_08755 [Oligoflexia bacterium]|nr:hypothetical protein [Oligoflexia bacterium]
MGNARFLVIAAALAGVSAVAAAGELDALPAKMDAALTVPRQLEPVKPPCARSKPGVAVVEPKSSVGAAEPEIFVEPKRAVCKELSTEEWARYDDPAILAAQAAAPFEDKFAVVTTDPAALSDKNLKRAAGAF